MLTPQEDPVDEVPVPAEAGWQAQEEEAISAPDARW